MDSIKIGARVTVSPDATGLVDWRTGTVTGLELFAGKLFAEVKDDEPTEDGLTGITVTNLSLLASIS